MQSRKDVTGIPGSLEKTDFAPTAHKMKWKLSYTACPLYQDIRDTYFLQIITTQNNEVKQCANTAA